MAGICVANIKGNSDNAFQDSRLARLSPKTGLLIRPGDSSSLAKLFDELERYDTQERAETIEYLKRALKETATRFVL